MPLNYEKPDEVLSAELTEVALGAKELIDYFNKLNIPLPAEFPRQKLQEIAVFLIELPDGTARGCREPLLFAQEKLAEIRGSHIARDDEQTSGFSDSEASPRPARREPLDDKLTTLMSAVSTALQVANRQYLMDIELQAAPDPAVIPPNKAPIDRISSMVRDSERAIAAHRRELDEIRSPESANADLLRRRFTDAISLNRLARTELAMPRIVPAWLKRIGNALREYPKLLASAAGAIKVAADVADWAHDKWSRYSDEIFRSGTKLIRDVSNDISQYAVDLEEYRKTQLAAAVQRKNSIAPGDMSFADLRQIIIEGKSVPPNWRERIRSLDLSHEAQLLDLGNLAELEHLEELLLSRTNVYDLSPLSGLKKLSRLEISRTMVTNIEPIAALTHLKRLDLDGLKLSNIEPLQNLTKIEELDLSRTLVLDLRPLQRLTELRKLDLSRTEVSNIVPISVLSKLVYLDLSYTKVKNLFAVGRLNVLRELHVTGTDIGQEEIQQLLGFLNLQIFSPPSDRPILPRY